MVDDHADSPLDLVCDDGEITIVKQNGDKVHIPIQFENSAQINPARKRGRPKTHGRCGTPTYTSYVEAKKRCTNPNHRQYKDYGGRGIKFAFNSVEELVRAIGERPAGTTLDRIDGSRHYQPDNVKWSTPQEQAANRRRPNEPAKVYQGRALLTRWQAEGDFYRQRQDASRAWSLYVNFLNRTPLSQAEVDFLVNYQKQTGLPRTNFHRNHPYDHGRQHFGFIMLPALTDLGSSVVLQAGPFGGVCRPDDCGHGYLGGMKTAHPSLNCSEDERASVSAFIREANKGGLRGLCLTGDRMEVGAPPIEGSLLAIASYLGGRTSVDFVPMAELEETVWNNQQDRYDSQMLFVPDLRRSERANSIRKLFLQRIEALTFTVIYTESLAQLGERLGRFIENQFKIVELASLRSRPAHVFPDGPKLEMPPGPDNEIWFT